MNFATVGRQRLAGCLTRCIGDQITNMQTLNHIAIWGVGAMGSLFSGYLSAVAPVTMVGNWQEQIDAVRRKGLTIHHGNGRASRFFPAMTRQALHAWRLALTHPSTGERIDVTAPIPDDMTRLLDIF